METRQEATRTYYDEFSNWYERERAKGYHALIDDLEISIAEPYARGARVLEVGCGTGLILHRLARVARQAAGIDLSHAMLAKAKARGLDVSQAVATALPFPDGHFDMVCSFKVLAHVEEIDLALAEMARVTAPGGTILAEFYNPYSLRWLAKRLGGPGAISSKTREDAVYTRFDTPEQLIRRAPPNTRFRRFQGVRIVTPAAFAMKIPVLAQGLRGLEFALRDGPAAKFAGFLVAVYEKL